MHSTGRRDGLRDERRKGGWEGRNFPPASYVTCVGTGLGGFDLKCWISLVRFQNGVCFMHLGTTLKRKGNVMYQNVKCVVGHASSMHGIRMVRLKNT